jgi:hypothetical protein
MLLYTGAAYVDGEAPLVTELAIACAEASSKCEVTEIDPDVFGGELLQRQYALVERIAIFAMGGKRTSPSAGYVRVYAATARPSTPSENRN